MKQFLVFIVAALAIAVLLTCIMNWSFVESYWQESIVLSVIKNESGNHHIKGFSIDVEDFENASDVELLEKLLRTCKLNGVGFIRNKTMAIKLHFSGFHKIVYVEWISETELSISMVHYDDMDQYLIVFSDADRQSELYAIFKRKVPR